jgi:hypothetical protein
MKIQTKKKKQTWRQRWIGINLSYQIKKDEIGKACKMHEDMENFSWEPWREETAWKTLMYVWGHVKIIIWK